RVISGETWRVISGETWSRVISGETWPHVQELLPTVLGLLKKKDARSEIWKYFGYVADCEGKPIDPSVKHVSKPLRQGEATRQIWLSTSQTDTPNFSESSKNDRLANVIINMNTPKLTPIHTSSLSLVSRQAIFPITAC